MKHLARLLSVAAVLVLSACGGDNDPPAPSPAPPSGIGPAGGTVTGPSGSQAVVPPNALTTTVAIQIAQSEAGAPPLPAGRTAIGQVFAFTPHGTAFAVPVTVTVPFDAAQLPNGETPQLWKTNAAQTGWEPVSGATVAGSALTGSVGSFSWFVGTKATAVAPAITTQPASVSVIAGQSASFSVAVDGTAPFAYQWKRNGADIPGANAPTYTVASAATADNGVRFSVVVSNSAGSVTSGEAVLTVTAAPVAPTITTPPASLSVVAGQPASFTVAASGTAPLAYQWKRDGADIGGATADTFTLASTALSDNGAKFSVAVSNSAGNVTSAEATLTVTAAAGSLGTPTRLDTRATALQSSRVRMVLDGAGNATAVWAQNAETGSTLAGIFTRRFDAASGQWGSETRLDSSTPSVTTRTGPSVAMDDAGNVFVSWAENGMGMAVRRYSVSTGTWGPPDFVSTSVGAAPATISTDAAGNALLLFTADEPAIAGFQTRMRFSRYDAATGTFSVPQQIESYAGSLVDSADALLAANAAGDALAVWVRGDAAAQTTVFARYTASTGTWSAPAAITAPSPAGLLYDGDGNGILLAGNGLFRYTGGTNAFTRSSGIASTALITNFNTKIAAAGNGRALAVSIDDVGAGTALLARSYDPATNAWSAPVQITDVLANDFRIGAASNGEAVVLFERGGIFASRRAAGGSAWDTPRRVNRDSVTSNIDTAAAAILSTGRFAAVWTEVDEALGGSAPSDVWGNVIAP